MTRGGVITERKWKWKRAEESSRRCLCNRFVVTSYTLKAASASKILQVVILIRKRCFEKIVPRVRTQPERTNINHSSIDFPINFNSLLSADVYVVRADGVADFVD